MVVEWLLLATTLRRCHLQKLEHAIAERVLYRLHPPRHLPKSKTQRHLPKTQRHLPKTQRHLPKTQRRPQLPSESVTGLSAYAYSLISKKLDRSPTSVGSSFTGRSMSTASAVSSRSIQSTPGSFGSPSKGRTSVS